MHVIGIAGGTGSGKTTLAYQILKMFPDNATSIIYLDNYYKDQRHISFDKRKDVNYDHPLAIEHELLMDHINQLKNGNNVDIPLYDFTLHTRSRDTKLIRPTPILIIEGIFALYYEEILNLLDLKIFVDTESDIRFSRRLVRDMRERGRSIDSVIHQYFTTVKPMHDTYVEPTKKYADIIVPEGGRNKKAIKVLHSYIDRIIEAGD
ncbi:MAG: uridine kinase [Eubacteriaceae bacterium]|nr:uridine kinase [Eubacteriaceae bacterium]